MSSRLVFKLVNAIHHEIAEGENTHNPFGSKQITIVGEFLQLRPVPSTFDNGEFMFCSQLFSLVITHSFELTTMMSHNLCDKTFITVLKELCSGTCSP